MMIHEITEKVGRYKDRKRLGRGEATGQGCTAGRGHKGAGSRSGFKHRPAYEGGQMPIMRRTPKRGFSNVKYATVYHVVNLRDLEAKLDNGVKVDADVLADNGIIRDTDRPVKILADGKLTKKFTITAAKFSKAALEKIEKAGGSVTVVEPTTWSRATAGEGWKKRRRAAAARKNPPAAKKK